MSEYAGTIADKVDVILFAQGSMAYCEEYIHEKYGKVVLSSPRFGAAALKDALVTVSYTHLYIRYSIQT